MKTFCATRKIKIGYLLSFLLMIALAGFLGYLSFSMFSALTNISDVFKTTSKPIPLISALICSTPLLLLILLSAWIGFYGYATSKARLTFGDNAVTFETVRHFVFLLQSGLKPFEIPYDQIESVKSFGLVGTLQILDTKDKKFTLIPAMFGKNFGEEVLRELGSHVPTGCIESGMEIPGLLRKWAKGNKVRVIILLSFLIPYLSTFFIDPQFSSRSWFVPAWNVERQLSLFEHVWTYSLISQNELWLVANGLNSYQVYHYVSNEVVGAWDLPKTADYYPDFVSDDGNEKPIVWFEDGVLRYNGAWKYIKYENNLDLEEWYGSGVVAGNHGWAIREVEGEENQLLYIDGLTGEWSEIPLPDTAIQQKLFPRSARQVMNGDILILMTNDASARVYLLSDNMWKPSEFPIFLLEGSEVRSFFLDENNFFWALFSCGEKWFVESITSTNELRITQLRSPNRDVDEWERYEDLFVDMHGRIWVNGSYPEFISVVSPVWEGEASEIVRYTEDNSNYQGTRLHPHVMSSDGRIWTFDRKISTMDTNLESLPSPLPDWFANLDWNLIRLYINLALLPFFLYLFIYSFNNLRVRKPKIPK